MVEVRKDALVGKMERVSDQGKKEAVRDVKRGNVRRTHQDTLPASSQARQMRSRSENHAPSPERERGPRSQKNWIFKAF